MNGTHSLMQQGLSSSSSYGQGWGVGTARTEKVSVRPGARVGGGDSGIPHADK